MVEVRKGIYRFYQLHINPNGYTNCLKTVFQGIPIDLSHLSDPELLGFVVANFKPPQRYLDSAAVTLREGGRVILQDFYAISPVLTVKIISEPVPNPRRPLSSRKGAGVMCRAFWGAGFIYLG